MCGQSLPKLRKYFKTPDKTVIPSSSQVPLPNSSNNIKELDAAIFKAFVVCNNEECLLNNLFSNFQH